ncbi:hypothetical protein Scep_002620 [Stephania cephalantha]|uniref:Uncharacterized protein n=1 Tax=Stephania cephalantha TaxID=152367 RepID=A0AAP0LEB3_9MAGN
MLVVTSVIVRRSDRHVRRAPPLCRSCDPARAIAAGPDSSAARLSPRSSLTEFVVAAVRLYTEHRRIRRRSERKKRDGAESERGEAVNAERDENGEDSAPDNGNGR